MSPTEEYRQGRLARALTGWGAQLAAGRSWTEVEDEIVTCCEGRVDLLTGLLLEAETVRSSAPRPRRHPSTPSPYEGRPTLVSARQRGEVRPDRAVASVRVIGQQS